MYVSSLSLSFLFTVVWYITPCVKQFPSKGHIVLLRQLQFLVVGSVGLVLLIMVLLWLDIIWLIFGVQL